MNRIHSWTMVLLILAGLLLSACGQRSQTTEALKPAVLEKIAGTDYNRIMLTEKAASRLDIQTEPVRVEQVKRVRTLVGEVVNDPFVPVSGEGEMAAAPIPGETYVLLRLNESDRSKIDLTQSALILLTDQDDDEEETGLMADLFDDTDLDDVEDDDLGEAVYFRISDAGQTLPVGQNVRVTITLAGNGSPQKVIPYAALLYDLRGETYVYFNPEPLVYIRVPVTVDYIVGDTAVLIDGPDEGTQVVTVGVAELYGADTGVGK
jgi:hypothetical protein